MDCQKIKKDFIKVIQHSQNIEDPQVDRLFDIWLESKRDIIEAFGGKLIYEIEEPVTFELSEEGKHDRIQNFINMCWDLGLEDLGLFIEYQRDGFFKNRCEQDYQEVTKGTKLVKAFKYFVDNPTVLTEMQNKASMIIQENKIEGKLCFSVHPLDYLSLSETTYNWRSCHALDGEYRAGNLSYMMDKSTIICYLKGEESVKLPNFPEEVPWNSKKWRVLFYISNNWKMIFAGKQYPFSTLDGMNMIVEKYFNGNAITGYRKPSKVSSYVLFKDSKWTKWTDYKTPTPTVNGVVFELEDSYIPIGGGLIPLQELVKDCEGSRQFNDVLSSTCYAPMYSYLVETGWYGNQAYTIADKKNTRFEIGNFTYCLRCGAAEVMGPGSSTMMCYNCERNYGETENEYFSFCHHCGARIETENGFYIEDNIYCENCFETLGAKCEDCCDYYLKDNMYYDEKEDSYYCHWCHNNNNA